MSDLQPDEIADLDQAYAEMRTIVRELIDIARDAIARFGPDLAAYKMASYLVTGQDVIPKDDLVFVLAYVLVESRKPA